MPIRQAASAGRAMIARGTRGALLGALLTAAAGFAFVLLVSLALLSADDAMDSERKMEILRANLALAATSGGFLGAIGGAAARLPRNGLPLLTSIAIVAACAAVARAATLAVTDFQKFGYPYAPAILAAVLGGVGVLISGVCRGKRRLG